MRTRYKIGLLTIVIAIMQFPTMGASASTAEFLGRVGGLVVGSLIFAIVLVYAVVVGLTVTKRILQGPQTDTKK